MYPSQHIRYPKECHQHDEKCECAIEVEFAGILEERKILAVHRE